MRIVAPLVGFLGVLALAACGGGGGGAVNQSPVITLAAPQEALTFKAGDTIAFSASASDPQDGALGATQLSWGVALHHDEHAHDFVNTQGPSGSFLVPTRGETSPNIFYRFTFTATDSAGNVSQSTRDVLPQKAELTLATVPAGLQLGLDGALLATPRVITGVVGIERRFTVTDQNFNGRRYRFNDWSDGGDPARTVSTPAVPTTYTARFEDIGVATNEPPTVAVASAAQGLVGAPQTLSAVAGDPDPGGSVERVEFFDGGSSIGVDITRPFSVSWTPAASGSRVITAFATDRDGASTTSAPLAVTVTVPAGDVQPPVVVLTAPLAYADNLAGALAVTATATDNAGPVQGVDFEVDGVSQGPVDSAEPYGFTLDTTLYADGQHKLRARTTDAAGNVSAWAEALVRFKNNRSQAAGFVQQASFVVGLSSATAIAAAPDGRLFVAEQGGALRVVKNGALLAAPFMQLTVDASGERGLLGVTLDPAFASNGHVFVYYTLPTAGAPHNRVSRFTAAGDVAAPGSELALVDLPDLLGSNIHNGGGLNFGIDGKLYVAVGDNATATNAPDLSRVFGKMLRFNADGSIPADNPFYATQTGLARAVWAYGLRNPFTFAVQAGTGRMFINDVGLSSWEEVNEGAAAANYGWPSTEGPTNVTAVTAPLFAYPHDSPTASGPGGFFNGFAIIGGAFYPSSGGNFPASHRGNYFFADFVNSFVGVLDLRPGADNAAYSFATLSDNPVGMAVGADGALYILTRLGITRIGVAP